MKFNLDNLIVEFDSLEKKLWDPEIFKDQKKIREVSSRKKQIEEATNIYREYKNLNESLEESKEMLDSEKDEDMRDMLKEEIKEIEQKIPEFEEKLKIALLPKDLNDDKNIIVEIRAWTGWEEAALFAWELARSYITWIEWEWFNVEITSEMSLDNWWVKEMVFEVKGEWAYSRFKYESWVHRVQRIPETESKWRVHTSAITVAIMPEVDDIDIEIKPEDVEMSFCRSSWAWGQHVNKTDSAVHLKHLPSWIVVFCQDGRSQHKNKEKAFQILRAKLYAHEEEMRIQEQWNARLAQVGSWDRSEKIRTYNFPQDRVTDHRIGQNFSGIPQIMMWKLWHIVDACAVADQQMKLEAAGRGDI